MISYSLFYEDDDKPYTMADYRRELNNQCNECDYVIWGESDCLMPRQMFGILEQLKEHSNQTISTDSLQHLVLEKCGTRVGKLLEHPEVYR